MWVRFLAALAFLLLVWSLTRYALGLRAALRARERERDQQQAVGRRVVAELPQNERVVLFLEDAAGFYWDGRTARKHELRAARLFMNDLVLGRAARPDFALPEVPPPDPEAYDGSERWSVRLYLADGRVLEVSCGKLREGVSREAAGQLFDAVRAVLAEPA